MSRSLHIITGPTAVGKTEFALTYAERIGAEIVSCDASLVYRGMDIGTAKPAPAERERVPHHLIDICDVNTAFDIVEYDGLAKQVVAEIIARGRPVVVTGGSGFYLKSFLEPVIDTVKVSDSIRSEVRSIEAAEGLDGLLFRLRELTEDFGNLDTRNPRRVARALERCMASGKSLPELQADFAARPKPYSDFEKTLILLERDRIELEERVKIRADLMLKAGLVDEVEALIDLGIESNPSAASAIGYRETIAYLKGKLDKSLLLHSIVTNTLRLVKKQRTWFRTQTPYPDAKKITLSGNA